jgi:peptidyl-tRNA hydrolase, PTH1 family
MRSDPCWPAVLPMKLVVGLGNPGRKYEGTRHNIGYLVLAEVARKFGSGTPKGKFHGETMEADLAGQRALLLSPLTYMNQSGLSVQEAKSFYKISDEDLLVVCDDLNLPVAKLRFRAQGSSGGQKGLEDIIRRLGTEEFARLRIGIGSPPEAWDWANYVLSRFSQEELAEIELAAQKAASAVVDWACQGIQQCMNQYN